MYMIIKTGGGFLMDKNLYAAVLDRRTYYGISKESVVSDERIEEVINHAVKYTPSAFNSQSDKVVVLFG
jgi:predicted oxidoreductase (fatty acid repression mutant protein)